MLACQPVSQSDTLSQEPPLAFSAAGDRDVGWSLFLEGPDLRTQSNMLPDPQRKGWT